MIQITCTSCKNVLSIDDAFAGGVCRCQHCGTIQTVPARLKAGAPVETADSSAKSLYQNKARGAVATGSGSGLEDLAGIVASSGLADSRLRRPPQGPSARQKNQMLLLGAACGVIVLLLAILAAVMFHNNGKNDSTNSPTPQTTPPSAFAPNGPGKVIEPEADPTEPPKPTPHANTGPNYCGIKLTTDKIVYLIDNGSSSSKVLDYIKSAVYQSISSLGPDKEFAIIFWNPDSNSFGPTNATAEHLKLAKSKIEDVIAYKSTEPVESMKKALALNPGEIILITAKGLELEEQTSTDVIAARGTSSAKIHVVDINGSADDLAASEMARKTGGTFSPITERDLEAAGE